MRDDVECEVHPLVPVLTAILREGLHGKGGTMKETTTQQDLEKGLRDAAYRFAELRVALRALTIPVECLGSGEFHQNGGDAPAADACAAPEVAEGVRVLVHALAEYCAKAQAAIEAVGTPEGGDR